ncbi:MAG: hypothetical protein LBL65_05360 [Campylobacteraceae bacterium]|nr:hypothetical protein [Campylobacteraceae bacterium]
MYKAILEGKKTQTRRICPIQPAHSNEEWQPVSIVEKDGKDKKKIYYAHIRNDSAFHDMRKFFNYKYLPDEVIYVKEPYAETGDEYGIPVMAYKYTDEAFALGIDTIYFDTKLENWIIDNYPAGGKWGNPLFMPEKYARLFLRIKRCRIERVRAISNEDCFTEGIYETRDVNNIRCYTWDENDPYIWLSPQKAYAALFNKINGKGSYEANPYVFVYQFKIEERK